MEIQKKLKLRIRNWYLGDIVGSIDNGGLFATGHIKRPFIAKAFDFICREYKWFIGLLIALLMAYLAYRR